MKNNYKLKKRREAEQLQNAHIQKAGLAVNNSSTVVINSKAKAKGGNRKSKVNTSENDDAKSSVLNEPVKPSSPIVDKVLSDDTTKGTFGLCTLCFATMASHYLHCCLHS